MTNLQILFKLENLFEQNKNNHHYYNEDSDAENIIDGIWYFVNNIIYGNVYLIEDRYKKKIKVLLDAHENNKTILAANLILKLKLEDQYLR